MVMVGMLLLLLSLLSSSLLTVLPFVWCPVYLLFVRFLQILTTAWLFNGFDEQTGIWYFNDTGCAVTLVLKIVLLIWFIVSANHTKDKFLRKRRFYNK